jgi:hypothetical protein
MGKWEIRCYFDWRGLVIMPVDPLKILTSYYGANELAGPSERSHTQIEDPFTGITSLTLGTFAVNGGGGHNDWVITLAPHANEVWTRDQMISLNVATHLATFQLRSDVVEELKVNTLNDR